jgi:hypothetical protein
VLVIEQVWNDCPPMDVTLSGMFNVLNCEQLKNAESPIDKRFPPNATAGIFEQP